MVQCGTRSLPVPAGRPTHLQHAPQQPQVHLRGGAVPGARVQRCAAHGWDWLKHMHASQPLATTHKPPL